ncbi:uncharacterized protein LOC104438120 isoform X2 [Eucalyptus grandis]|uniref:uncharacterized protein LOC104438120 isoform X2 n=1 Tax=Eucalyptus grandis TaxID=71139 RepID=UPI00192F07E3|nr:uncharacterized protein LOC104438120 isoform X2 [Eucalyptus grandis]
MDIPSGVLTLPPPPVANEEGNSEGTRTDKGLLEVAMTGHWTSVQQEVSHDSKSVMAEVMTVEDGPVTVLEAAVIGTHDHLVENLVELLPPRKENLNLKRALCNAARGGRIRMVKALISKIEFESESLALALLTAISWAPIQKEVIWYLARKISSRHDDTISKHDDIISSLTLAGHMDIVLFLENSQQAASEDTKHDRMLAYLVPMLSYFRSRARLNFWENIIYKNIPSCLFHTSFGKCKATELTKVSFIKRIVESKLRQEFGNLALLNKIFTMDIPKIREFLLTSNIVIDAASRGISDFVQLCLMFFPELMWEKNFTKELIKEVVKGRHVELFRRLSAHNTTPYLTDDELTRRSLMEAVVEWSPRCVSADVSGAAFLIQRELQWFKVVEDMSDPSLKRLKFKVSKEEDGSDPSFKSLKLEETKERRGKTYWEVFVEQRQDLLKEAGQWMKDTSSSCSLISTLIITVAFAAAFTAPGGNDDDGIPIFLKKSSFIVFAIADALALFSSVTATLMFLAILTSRYAIEDFVHSLPRKMILGLTFLFLSLAFMMVAFGSALTMVLNQRLEWIYIPITLFAAIPIILFALLQLPLYVEMFESTGWPPLYRPIKIWK